MHFIMGDKRLIYGQVAVSLLVKPCDAYLYDQSHLRVGTSRP